MLRQQLEKTQAERGRIVTRQEPLAAFSDDRVKPPGRDDGLPRDDGDALEEVREPPLPVTLRPDGAKAAVILLPVGLEEEAEVEQRPREQPPVTEQQRDQQPTQAAVAVQVGVQGLELYVEQPDPHQRRQVTLVVDGVLELAQ